MINYIKIKFYLFCVVIFIIWNTIVIGKIVPLYYGIFRVRYNYEKMLNEEKKKSEYIFKIIKILYNEWMYTFIQFLKINNILLFEQLLGVMKNINNIEVNIYILFILLKILFLRIYLND